MNFNKKFDSYDENAIVQKKVASHLIELIKEIKNDKNSFESILEIGCGTGIFTREFLKSYSPNKIILNDFFQVERFLNNIPYNSFLVGDILKIELPKVETIVSSSVFQWISPLEKLIEKLSFCKNLYFSISFLVGDILKIELPKVETIVSSSVFQWISPLEKLIEKLSFCKNLYFSIYISGNLKEIDEHFNISLDYLEVDEIKNILKKYFTKVKYKKESISLDNISLDYLEVDEIKNILKKYFTKVKYKKESISLDFNTPLDALRHLKNSGVTGFKKSSFSKIKSFSSKTLTYEIGYFLCEK